MKQASYMRNQSQSLKRSSFKLNPVAAGCAVLVMGFSNIAYAQEVAAENTVVVTGIRKGIEEAISVKKNASSIVEAVSAEDIGKLPDTSIAESIARLPGVTAQRTNGRAQAISVRGMSPDFSSALLNGREQTSTGDSRSVYFDQFPSELLSGVVIYKTPDASLVGQGLSGTIDMQTVRPLDFSKRTIAANYRRERLGAGLDNPGSGSRASFSYIDQFADRKIGIALGFARLDDTSGTNTKFESWGGGTTTYNGQTVNVPFNGFNAESNKTAQTRDGAMAVIQFKPNKEFSSTLDVFYSKFDSTTTKNILQVPLNDSWNSPTGQYDHPGVLINAILSGNNVVSGTFNNVRPVVRNEPVIDNETMTSIGWNNALQMGGWKTTLDLNHSTAKRVERDQEVYAGIPGDASKSNNMFSTFTFDTSNGRKFSTNFNYADPNIIKITDGQGWGGGPGTPQAGYSKGPTVNDKIDSLRLSGKHDLPEGTWFTDVEIGTNYSKRSKVREVNEYLLQVANGAFAGLDITGGYTAFAGDTGIPILGFDASGRIPGLNFVTKQHPDIWNKDWRVDEKVWTTLAKANMETQIGRFPVTGNVGLQFIRTDQSSSAYSVNKDGGTSDANRPVAPYTAGKTYNDVLPSLNLSADMGNQTYLRFALAKIMARPKMDDMRASNGFSLDTTKGIYVGSGGNPTLNPFRATGVDISVEKYFDKKGYVSAAVFYKNLDSYIINLTNPNFDFTPLLQPTTLKASTNIGQFTLPTNGSGGSIKGFELAGSMPFSMLHKALDGFGAVANFSNTESSLAPPNTTDGNSGGNMELPGLSKKVASLTLYYEKHGFSFRVAERYRSDFVGEIIGFGGDRTLTYIKGEKIIDLQLGYEFDKGWAKGLSLLLQVNNLGNTPFIRYKQHPDGSKEEIENTKYGKTILFGLNYKL